MDPFFTEKQLNNMSLENMMEVMRIMQNHAELGSEKRDRVAASER